MANHGQALLRYVIILYTNYKLQAVIFMITYVKNHCKLLIDVGNQIKRPLSRIVESLKKMMT